MTSAPWNNDRLTPSLLDELRAGIGAGTVRTDEDARRSFGRDRWVMSVKNLLGKPDNPLLPACVVRPVDTEGVAAVMRWANRHQVPLIPYGAGSGVLGGTVPVRGGITIDLGGFDQIDQLDEDNLLVTVGAGMLGGVMEDQLQVRGYTVGHYPQSLHISSAGGWVAARGSGTFSSRYGNPENMIAGLEAVLPNGDVLRTKPVPRSAAGPDLSQLFVGSEGTLGVITRVVFRMWPMPERRAFRAVSFASFGDGLRAIRKTMRAGYRPAVARLYDAFEGRGVLQRFGHDTSRCLLVLAFDGPSRLSELEEEATVAIAAEHDAMDLGREPAEHWERNRFDVAWSTERLEQSGGIAEAIEVSNVWSRLEETYERMTAAIRPHMQEVYGHVSHVYPQGASLYVICRSLEADDAAARRVYEAAFAAATDACLATGSTIAHHHGVGLQRAPWMEAELGRGLDMLRSIKAAIDPRGIMNPGKLGLKRV